MKSALPLENTRQFFKGLKTQVGKILEKEFVNDENGTRAIYKTQFERAVLGIYIMLDSENKIEGLLIKPYEEPKNIEGANVNALDDYPSEIAEIVFQKVNKLPNKSQLSIAIVQNGEVEFYGTIRDGEAIKPIDNQNSVFEIGSITKVFTSSVLTSLIEDKEIKLTDNINSFYPFDFKDNIKLTFKSLANHTSGLASLPENLDLIDLTNPYKSYCEIEI